MASNDNPRPFKKAVIRNFVPLPPANFVVRKMVIAPPSNGAASIRDTNAQRNGSKKENGLNFGEGHKPKGFEYEGPKLSVNGAVSLIFSSVFYWNCRKQ
jgi:hypothetical protein